MKEKIKKKFFLIHSHIDNFFYFLLTEIFLPIITAIIGVVSWMYPVFKIWTDAIDRELTLLKSIGYILIGVILFYVSLVLYKLREKLKTNNKSQ